ncbi:hypothetical protein KCU78_g4368, partial [Aureobasidium melanogenum]
MSSSWLYACDCPTRYRYPYLQDSYDNAMLSDVVLCFGGERVYAHKVTLMAASGVFKATFNSNFPVANKGTFEVNGHSNNAVYAMLQHIYSKPPGGPAPVRDFDEELDHHIVVFSIGNEYEIESLCQFSARDVVWMIRLIPRPDALPLHYQKWPPDAKFSHSRQQFSQILERTATLYINSSIADQSLLDAVISTYFDIFPGLGWMKCQLELSGMLERMDVFSPRLIRACRPER